MLWTAKDHEIGDVTIIRVGQEYHLFTEQSPIGATGQTFANSRTVGHAVSRDLFHWQELPPAVGCGPEGSCDHYTIFHMDVFVHDGAWYMYYTALDIAGPGQQQTVALATSRDGIAWEKHPGNPILRADPRYYEQAIPREATYQEKDFGRLWFRDPCIIRNPETGEFGMIVIARDSSRHPDVNGCLAWATSRDLVHWQPRPAIYSPGRFHTIETPSIFEHDGRHYIIFMSHPAWGAPVMATDPYQDAGDFYAVSDNGWTGPYERPEDEVVVAAHRQLRMGAMRTVDGPDGDRYLYGWLSMDPRGDDLRPALRNRKLMPPPRRVHFTRDGAMEVVYHEGIESFCRLSALSLKGLSAVGDAAWNLEDGIRAKDFGGRSIALFPGSQADVIVSARLRFLRGERAGLVLRADESGTTGWQVVADRRYGRIEFGTLDGDGFIDARSWPARDEVELKAVVMGPTIEIYADDRLMIHQVRYREASGRIGLLVDRAEADFEPPRLLRFEA